MNNVKLPRVLSGVQDGPVGYQRHRSIHGELPAVRGRARAIMAELDHARLRGRGGGQFPLAFKLDAVRRAPGTPVLVVNGCEGEPMSAKDRLLLRALPHLVLDGAVCCAQLLQSEEILVTVEASRVQSASAVERAVSERGDIDASVIEVPPGYVSGQETALVRFINGGPPVPSHIPPRVTDRGVSGRPTLVVNPETLTHAALIARHGADWFRGLGTPEEPGSALITLSGSVRSPGVYEIECGSSLGSLIQAAGGAQEPIRAFLAGGYAGGWIDGHKAASVLLSRDGLRRHGTSLGPGVVVAFGQNACPVAEVTRVAAWLADQSAHQCGPCDRGLGAIADTISAVCYGESSATAVADIRRWSAQVTGRGACAHPDGAARFVTTAMSVFAAEFEDHAQYGLCDACSRHPTLRTGFHTPIVA